MKKKNEPSLTRELIAELHLCGMMTAITDVKGRRFLAYLQRPSRMLSDGWRLSKSDRDGEVRYQLFGHHDVTQELRIDRGNRAVELVTSCPYRRQTQSIVFCQKQNQVISNTVVIRYPEHVRKRDLLLFSPR